MTAATLESDVINSLQEAERAIQHITKQGLAEMASFANPPKAIIILMEAIGIFLQPDIPSDKFTWKDGRKLLRNSSFLQALLTFDKEQISAEEVTRAASYMKYEEMQPATMIQVSQAGGDLLAWFRAMYLFGQVKHQTVAD